MISRVTNQTMMMSAERNLASNKARLAQLQDQASSLKAISVPSDDPTGTANALGVRAQQAANAQYSRNIDNGNGWLSTLDSALSDATTTMRQVRDLTIQASNGSLTPAAKEAIASQLDTLKQQLLSQANTTFMGRNVFAGNSSAGAAFSNDPASGVVYNGTSSSVDRRVADGVSVRVDADGAATFGTGASSAFALIDTIASDLRAGSDPSANLAAIDTSLNAIITQRTDVGGRLAQIQKAQDANMTQKNALEAQRSGIEDVDLSKAVLDLQLQQTNYQAALAITAKVLPQSLMDFLR